MYMMLCVQVVALSGQPIDLPPLDLVAVLWGKCQVFGMMEKRFAYGTA